LGEGAFGSVALTTNNITGTVHGVHATKVIANFDNNVSIESLDEVLYLLLVELIIK